MSGSTLAEFAERAAGVGRLELVQGFFTADGGLTAGATRAQLEAGFAWACEYGRSSVIDFLLRHGMAVDAPLKHHGQTGLHWAAFGGYVQSVRLLLARQAPVDVKDPSFGSPPLGWALEGWRGRPDGTAGGHYPEVVALLVASGATVEPGLLADEAVRADLALLAALHGEGPR